VLADVEALKRRIIALPSQYLPVPWFLDIDGVINVIGNRPRDGWPRYANTMIAQGVNGLAWPVCYAPGLVELLNLLAQRQVVSFRWLTTWEHDGPKRFAPAVGLTLGRWVAAENLGTSPGWWKLDAIVEHVNDSDELFIWTDDDLNDSRVVGYGERHVIDMLPARVVTISPDPRRGLTPEQFEMILMAIEEVAWR
jgi:hypothetical protein